MLGVSAESRRSWLCIVRSNRVVRGVSVLGGFATPRLAPHPLCAKGACLLGFACFAVRTVVAEHQIHGRPSGFGQTTEGGVQGLNRQECHRAVQLRLPIGIQLLAATSVAT